MPFIEVLLLALAMAVDAFTVCLAVASTGQLQGARPAFRLSFHFGLFQFIMPLIGWLCGMEVGYIIQKYDHWVAFSLLAFVGLRMIKSALSREEETRRTDPSRGWTLVLLSIAVSIDALAIGLTLGLLGVSVLYPALLIGVVTGALSLVGLRIGRGVSGSFGRPFEMVGGLVLVGIGVRIILDHLLPL